MGDNASSTTSNEGDDASLTMAETRLRMDNSDDSIVTRATITIATTAKMPVHQQQQLQLANK
jgi:hypothetical protein